MHFSRSDSFSKPSHSGRNSCDSEIQLDTVDELQSDKSSFKVSFGGVCLLTDFYLLKLFFNFTNSKLGCGFLRKFLLYMLPTSIDCWMELWTRFYPFTSCLTVWIKLAWMLNGTGKKILIFLFPFGCKSISILSPWSERLDRFCSRILASSILSHLLPHLDMIVSQNLTRTFCCCQLA